MAVMATRKRAEWLKERNAQGAWIVLRIDVYRNVPFNRGQFYPNSDIPQADRVESKAIWPTEKQATDAAKWATKQFGGEYGVFQMTHIVRPREAPIVCERV